jgi:hypothetical protein
LPFWQRAILSLSFELDKLFMLLVPDLVAAVAVGAGACDFPSEPDFVHQILSIW